jgi:PPM family protein phosphatase
MKIGNCKLIIENEHYKGCRELQEDYFAFHIPEIKGDNLHHIALILADGMGGLPDGQLSSVIAVDQFMEAFENKQYNLRDLAHKANDTILNYSSEENMGTTAVVLRLMNDGTTSWISIGDSSLFLFREHKLHLLNKHHTLGQLLDDGVKGSIISPEDAQEREPQRDHLISWLGMDGTPEIEEQHTLLWKKDDIFLVASDGLTDSLNQYEIETILQNGQPGLHCGNLIKKVKEKNSPQQDNTTILSISLIEDENCSPEKFQSKRYKIHFWILIIVTLILVFTLGLYIGSNLQEQYSEEITTGEK